MNRSGVYFAVVGIILSASVFADLEHDAAKAGNLKALQQAVAKSSINNQDDKGYTALHWAVAEGKIELIPWLLKNGANVSQRANDEMTPLLLAGKYGRPQTAVYLIQAGADVNETGPNRITAVSLAAEQGHPEVLKVLLDRGANVNGAAVDCRGDHYCEQLPWPFDLAVRAGHREVIKLLFSKGAGTINPIAQTNDREMVEYLLGLGVKPSPGDLIDFSSRADTTLLKRVLDSDTTGAALSAMRQMAIHKDENYDVLQMTGFVPGPEAMRLLLDREPTAAREAPTLLHRATQRENSDVTKLLLSRGFAVNARDMFGNTPLHWAVSSDRYQASREKDSAARRMSQVALLLDHGADVNARNDWGNSVLHRACQENFPSVVKYLTDRGANVNVANEPGVTPLHMAAVRGYSEIVQILLSNKANPNARMEARKTQPLHAAVAVGHADTVKLLLEHGADVNGLANSKMSPLHYALTGSYTFEISENDRYGWPNTDAYKGNWDSNFGGTQRVSVVRLLVKHGANVNVQTDWSATPLHLAVAGFRSLPITVLGVQSHDPQNVKSGFLGPNWTVSDRAEAVQVLLTAGAKPRPESPLGYPAPLDMACGQNPAPFEIVKLLAGSDRLGKVRDMKQICDAAGVGIALPANNEALDIRDRSGATLLLRAARAGDFPLVMALLKRGANPNADNDGTNGSGMATTPLQAAAAISSEMTKLLVEKGARVDRPDMSGRTPLHYAVQSANTENVKLLLKHGANPNAMDKWKHTPLHLAVHLSRRDKITEMIASLLAAGADPWLVQHQGKTAIDLAQVKGNQEIINLLLARGRKSQAR